MNRSDAEWFGNATCVEGDVEHLTGAPLQCREVPIQREPRMGPQILGQLAVSLVSARFSSRQQFYSIF